MKLEVMRSEKLWDIEFSLSSFYLNGTTVVHCWIMDFAYHLHGLPFTLFLMCHSFVAFVCWPVAKCSLLFLWGFSRRPSSFSTADHPELSFDGCLQWWIRGRLNHVVSSFSLLNRRFQIRLEQRFPSLSLCHTMASLPPLTVIGIDGGSLCLYRWDGSCLGISLEALLASLGSRVHGMPWVDVFVRVQSGNSKEGIFLALVLMAKVVVLTDNPLQTRGW